MINPVIQTERLILRQWQPEDFDAFAAMNADARVMEFFPSIKTREESFAEYQAILDQFKTHHYGWWAVSEIGKNNFLGFIGIRYIDFPAAFTPAFEIGWRLVYDCWGKGYATEGAKAALKYGFEVLHLPEIISFTSTLNLRSMAVMEKIGMRRCPEDDFDHPKLPEGHRLRRHVMYRLSQDEWYQD
jgi:3-dehydroquinate dehydratase/shikimate dehydrogenase